MAQTTGERLRALRELRGWSQSDLAEMSGVTQPTLSRLEDDRVWPTDRTKVRVARALDVDPNELFPLPRD